MCISQYESKETSIIFILGGSLFSRIQILTSSEKFNLDFGEDVTIFPKCYVGLTYGGVLDCK